MDDAAFRASVFAEQKQLTAFSLQAPNERKKLVLQLLGITPLDAARDLVRKDARLTQEQFKRTRELLPDLTGLEAAAVDAQQRALTVEALAEAERKVAQLTVGDEPPPPDDAGHDVARAAADAAREALADVGGRLSAAVADASRARDAVDRSKELSGEADCPVCGQALGDAFEQVQAHRAAEVAQAEERTRTLQSERVALAATAEAVEARARELAAELKAAQQTHTAWEKRRDKHVEAEA